MVTNTINRNLTNFKLMNIKIRNTLPKDFDFILNLTDYNMREIIFQDWNADWEREVKPNFINAWKDGEKKVLEKNNILIGYFWFEKHFKKKEIFINSIQITQHCQRKGIGNRILQWLIKEAENDDLKYIRCVVQTKNIPARKFFEKNKFQFINETKSGLLIERVL